MSNKNKYQTELNAILDDPLVRDLIIEVEHLYGERKLLVELNESMGFHGGFLWEAEQPTIHLNSKAGINKSNICHELIHAIQFALGFPVIKSNIYEDKREAVIGELISNILHIHLVSEFKKRNLSVDGYLSPTIVAIKKGLSSRKKKDIKALPIIRIHYDALVYLRIFYEATYLDSQERKYIGSLFCRYSPVAYELTFEIKKTIDKRNVLEPKGCAQAILDCLILLNGNNSSSHRLDCVTNMYIASLNELHGKYQHYLAG
jgi:hypothetical protein